MGKRNATPEESAAEARRRAADRARIQREQREAEEAKKEHDARVAKIRQEGEARREALKQAAIEAKRREREGR